MGEFLDERFPVDVRLGMSYADAYAVDIVTTAGGGEYRRLVHPFPVRSFHVNVTTDQADLWARVLSLYHRAFGLFAGFRVKCLDDYTTNHNTRQPTPTDAWLGFSDTGVYPLRVIYGDVQDNFVPGIGFPYRRIYKPIEETVVVAVNQVPVTSGLTIDDSTGIITLTPAPSITDIVTAGCEFDLPCRFNSKIEVTAIDIDLRDCGSIELLELLQP